MGAPNTITIAGQTTTSGVTGYAAVIDSLPIGTEFGLVTRPILEIGQETMANSYPVVIASDQELIVTEVIPAFVNLQISVGLSAIQLGNNAALSGVLLRSLSSNTGIIYVGTSSVSSSNGFFLSPGDSIQLPVNNSNLVYLISDVASQCVCYIVG